MALPPLRLTELAAATALTPASRTYVVTSGQSLSTTLADLGEFLTSALADRVATAESEVSDFDARLAEINAVLAAKQNRTDTLDASRLTGTIDLARLPVLPGTAQVVSGGDLAALTTEQQTEITKGAIVTTTDGDRFVYRGTGSKTSEASYILLADIAPDWSTIAGKPTLFPPAAHGHAWGEITGKPTAFPPSAHAHAWADIAGKPTEFPPEPHTHPVATTGAAGLMSALDKQRLDALTGGDHPGEGGDGNTVLVGSLQWLAKGRSPVPAEYLSLGAAVQNVARGTYPALDAVIPEQFINYITAGATRIQADDAALNDYFGYSISISANGLTVAVGAFEDDNSGGADSGSVYIFVLNNNVWVQQARIQASSGAAGDRFGNVVALSADGLTLAIGAFEDDNSAGTNAGSVYLYTRSGNAWFPQARVQAADAGANDRFGYSIALSGDGQTLAVGTPEDANASAVIVGSVYVFNRNGSTWPQQARLLASDAAASDFFGRAVALSADGSTMVVGANLDDNSAGSDAGSVYVFTRSGATWSQQTRLQAADAAASDQFGVSVALAGDGATLAVGATGDDNSGGTNAGSVYVFTRSGTVWTEQARVQAADAAANDQFGSSISLSADGVSLAVGSIADDNSGGADAGSVYVFTRNANVWTQSFRFQAGDAAANDRFGNAIALSSDGGILAVGARLDDNSGGENAGSAYIFGAPVAVTRIPAHPLAGLGAPVVADNPAYIVTA